APLFRLLSSCLSTLPLSPYFLILFFTAPPPTEIYTLSLHDALPISIVEPSSARLSLEACQDTVGVFNPNSYISSVCNSLPLDFIEARVPTAPENCPTKIISFNSFILSDERLISANHTEDL